MPLPQIDPVAAWGIWEVRVSLPTGPVVIPPLPAAQWLEAAWRGGQSRYILDLVEHSTSERLAELLFDGELDLRAVNAAGRDALEAASGWRWWIAENLMLSCAASWPQVGGELTLRGVRASVVGLGEWICAAYAVLTRGHAQAEVNAFDQKLVMPPPGVEGGEEILEQMAMEMFGQMAYVGAAAAPFPGR